MNTPARIWFNPSLGDFSIHAQDEPGWEVYMLAAESPHPAKAVPFAVVEVSVERLRSVVLRVIPEAQIPDAGTLVYADQPRLSTAQCSAIKETP